MKKCVRKRIFTPINSSVNTLKPSQVIMYKIFLSHYLALPNYDAVGASLDGEASCSGSLDELDAPPITPEAATASAWTRAL